MKTKTSQAQSKWFVFRVGPAFKRGVHRYELGWVSLTTAAPGDAVRVLPYLSFSKMIPGTVFSILQNDTRNSI